MLIWVSTEIDQEPAYTFAQSQAEVMRRATALLSLSVKQRDRVLVCMLMTAEAARAMLACTGIGAVHSVVFGGFASRSLATRIDDAEPSVIVSTDAGSRSGKTGSYQPLLKAAIALASHKPAKVRMIDRSLSPFERAVGRSADCAAPNCTLYAGGTTGKPSAGAARHRRLRGVAGGVDGTQPQGQH